MSTRQYSNDADMLRRELQHQDQFTIHKTLGIELGDCSARFGEVHSDVTARLFQHAGAVHGGFFVLMMESAASLCAAFNIDPTKELLVGMEINANHIRSVVDGRLSARAEPIHVGRATHVYECKITNQEGALISVGRCTVAVRPQRKNVSP